MAVIGLKQKTAREAADALKKTMKDPVETESLEEGGKIRVITLEGDWTIFDRMDLDMWGGHMRFELRGHVEEPERDEGFYSLVGAIAAQDSALAGILVSKSTLQVSKQVTIKTQTETWVDGRSQGHGTPDERTEWRDITLEFARRADPGYGAGW